MHKCIHILSFLASIYINSKAIRSWQSSFSLQEIGLFFIYFGNTKSIQLAALCCLDLIQRQTFTVSEEMDVLQTFRLHLLSS